MADASISFDFKIKRGNEAIKDCDFCIDANYYICSHLDCDEKQLDTVLAKTSDQVLQEIVEWASDSCDHMYNILCETSGTMEDEIAEEEAKKMSEYGTEEYYELHQQIMDEMSFEVVSVELKVDGKIYRSV